MSRIAASKHKQVKRGVKEVVKALRKETKGCAWGGNLFFDAKTSNESQILYKYS